MLRAVIKKSLRIVNSKIDRDFSLAIGENFDGRMIVARKT